ncbi:MAG: pilus assembly protein PilM [Patescibacteria group bacterium]
MWNFFHFSRPQAFALDFSDLKLRLLEVRIRGKNCSATSFKSVKIPEGIMEHGLIRDQNFLAELIQDTYEHAQPRRPLSKKVVAELPEAQTFLHHFHLPRELEKEALEKELLRQVEMTIPFGLSDMAWDYTVLNASGELKNILFAAASAEVVEAYEHTLALAGLHLVALEPESSALTRSIAPQHSIEPGKAYALIDFGGSYSSTLFVDAEGIELSLTHETGGLILTQAVAKELKIFDDAAELRKCEKGFNDKEVGTCAEVFLQPIVKEFEQARAYVERLTGNKVVKIILCGGMSQMPGLGEYMGKTLKLPTEQAVIPLKLEGINPTELSVVTGSALRGSKLSGGLNFILNANP